MVVSDLFTAGMVTTSTTLSWALLLMILHPDVQREPGWGWEGGRGTIPSELRCLWLPVLTQPRLQCGSLVFLTSPQPLPWL